MMNSLPIQKQIQVIHALVEGNSIRSTERMFSVHRDTIMRLLVRVGGRCQRVLDTQMRELHGRYYEMDEIHTYVRKHNRMLSEEEKQDHSLGDQYVFIALDAETKLVPTFRIGKRTGQTALDFVQDFRTRLKSNGRIQLSTDGLAAYIDAVERSFGSNIDYAQVVKVFASVTPGFERYSPPRVAEVVSTTIKGNPDERHISTSYVESQNLTMRQSIRRFTRLTTGYSKKLENLKAAVALHFAHYNLIRIHSTLRMTPAMAAGISDHLWTWEELLGYTA
jgi:IS1 family transposase